MNKKLISVVSVFWLSSQSVFAEMKVIDDADLSDVTGQAGLTIDIAMGIEVGEFMYKDGGSIVIQGMRLGGMDHTGEDVNGEGGEVGTAYNAVDGLIADPLDATGLLTTDNAGGTTGLDNVRILVDVSGDGSEPFNNGGPSPGPGGSVTGIPDNYFNWAWGRHTVFGSGGSVGCGDNGTCEIVLGDGDLFIHADFIDSHATRNGRPQTIADFGMEFDAFKLKDSSYVAGDDIVDRSGTASSQSTTIMSNYRMEGYFGGFDLLLENKGNGFGVYDGLGGFTETGSGDAASKIKINTFFEVTEMEYDFDIIGVRYEKMKIHNQRGNKLMFDFLTQKDYTGSVASIGQSQGYAQSNVQIYAVKDAILRINSVAGVNGGTNQADYIDGIAMDTRFVGDMDFGHMSFGDTGQSIGAQYYTDMDFTTNLALSAH